MSNTPKRLKSNLVKRKTIKLKMQSMENEKYLTEEWIRHGIGASEGKNSPMFEKLTNTLDFPTVSNLPLECLNSILKDQDIDAKSRARLLSSVNDLKVEVANQKNKKENTTAALTMTFEEKLYWPKAILFASIFCMGPTFTIGILNLSGYDIEKGSYTSSIYSCTIPAIILYLLLGYLNGFLSLIFVKDLIANAEKVELKLVMESLLTNSGIVSALVLTVVTSSLQAEQPTNVPSSLLNQWYIAFLCLAFCFAINATMMSSICFLYMQPLSGDKLHAYMNYMALYYGEPTTSLAYCLLLLLNANVVWVWGQYGSAAGITAAFVMWFLSVRFIVCLQNLSMYDEMHPDLIGLEMIVNKDARDKHVIVLGPSRETKDKNVYDVVDVRKGDEHIIVYSEDSEDKKAENWAKVYQMAWPKELKSLGTDDEKFILKRETTKKLLNSYFQKCANEDALRSTKVAPHNSTKAKDKAKLAWETK